MQPEYIITKKSLIKEFFRTKTGLGIFLITLSVLESCVAIVLSLSIGNYYEILSDHHSNKGRLLHLFHISIPHDPQKFFIVFAGIVIIKMCLQFMEKYFSELLATSFSLSLQKKLFRHHIRMTAKDFTKKPVGKYLLRYSGDINSVRHYLTKGIFHFISDCLFLLISLILLMSIDVTVTLVIIAALTIGFLCMIFINKKLKEVQILHRNMLASNLHFVNEGLKAVTTIKLHNREYATINRYKKRTDKLMTINKRYIFFESINIALPHAFLSLTLLLVFIVHLYQGSAGDNTLGSGGKFIPYILLIILMFPMYKRFLEVSPVWQAGNISFSKIIAMLNLPLEENETEKEYLVTDGIIEFKNVSFSYSEGKLLFNNLNFCCRPGEINQLQGNYKSTIFKLILGIYHRDAGTILLDGTDANRFTKKSIRENIAFISDEIPLYGNSVFKCLYLKNNEADRSKATELLQALYFTSYNHPVNLDEKTGENGKHLSKSKYTKLIIARALLSNKKIILIDGLFEKLDIETQLSLQKLLNQLKDSHTIIVAGKVPAELKPLSILMAS